MPGTVLAKRYRIISLLGRGGMGEVYRADDLKLGQPVALKFLPEGVQRDQARLDRFLNEVKTALKVTHANVCRVYDLGEIDGQHYLSMEYVDGEDLASLIRRIGRLPQDKAVQIARQLCAGLAAAHEQGILHRDLKPANVMIDGRGRAKITDFGLAGLAEEIEGEEIRAGTPAYMAPEQLAGKKVTVRSDLYSLGLVMYELFTGRRAFEPTTPSEMAHLQQEATPSDPSNHVEGLDPAIERVILRCLEREPEERPSSALAVSASLPGGDPLAAALAAGETPSPEMVANAGSKGTLKPWVAVVCMLLVLVGIVGVGFLNPKWSLLARVSPDKPPDALADNAREIIRELGYTDSPIDSAYGFDQNTEYMDHIEENDQSVHRWDSLALDQPAAIYFWYRQSPQYLVPDSDLSIEVTWDDPDVDVPGMIGVKLDPKGRLLAFRAVPPQFDERDAQPQSPDWAALFTAAGLKMESFSPVPPAWNPQHYCDHRAAWKGAYPDSPDIEIRIEAAAYRSQPVQFQIIESWTELAHAEPTSPRASVWLVDIASMLIFVSIISGAMLLARKNIRTGRGDRSGAFRIAMFYVALATITWLLGADHVPELDGEFSLLMSGMLETTFGAFIVWVTYLAIEPFVRRHWPNSIISWSRLLAGRLRDPLIGRDIVIGAVFWGTLVLTLAIDYYGPEWLGLAEVRPSLDDATALLGGRHLIASLCRVVGGAFFVPISWLLAFLLLRVILRRQWLAAGLFAVLLSLIYLESSAPLFSFASNLFGWAVFIWFFVRFGLLPVCVAILLMNLQYSFPLTFDFSKWYAGNSLIVVLLAIALVAYGFYTSLGGHPLIREETGQAR